MTTDFKTCHGRLVLGSIQLKCAVLYILVMFFMLHILVFTFYFPEKTSTARRTNNFSTKDYFRENAEIHHDIKERGRYNEREPPINHPMFQIIKNHSETHSNLKSNVFDKMLSEEMFSLKQNFFEKDSAYTSTVQKVTKSKVGTSISEAKHKWPALNLFTRPPNAEVDEDTKLSESRQYLKSKYNRPKIKSLDVRSLNGHQISHTSEIKCNCANVNSNHQCKHGEDCTRKPAHAVIMPNPVPYAPIYMPPPQFQPYFVGGEGLALGLPKTTRRRKPTPQECDLYYEDDCKRVKRPKNDEEIIMNIDYDIENIKPERDSCTHEDLKELDFYKRKCYCSSSRTAKVHQILIFISVLVNRFRVFLYGFI